MADTVNYEQDDAVAIISLNRPDKLNGFTSELCADLLLAFETAQLDDSVRAIVFTGEGRAFSAGADLRAGFDGRRTTQGKLLWEYGPVLTAIAEVPKPVIAAVPGFAAGIGMSFVLQSDLVVMASDAFLLSPFTTISLLPDGGLNRLLVRQVGYQRAFQLCIESERISADRCVELGLANRVAPPGDVRDVAISWAQELTKRAPLSVAATKKVMRHAMDADWHSCYAMEAGLQRELQNSEDAKEGVDAFLEKREPVFRGK
ncbi:MAG: enoyl-CoA hydratase/isomerase family protein [Woeseiaceae bacterium]|nr:enoyl-CoA hydratase/isomerase family protein [Woeseiaceae bacterium]